MARVRSEKREQAYEIWLSAEGNITSREIAEKLGVKDAQVRKWKSQDKWGKEEKLQELKFPLSKKAQKLQAKKEEHLKEHPLNGNKFGVGNKGGSAPLGNKNNLKTGEFEKIFFDTLTPDELILLGQMNLQQINQIEELTREIALLTIRERRIMKRIKEAEKNKLIMRSVSTSKGKDNLGNLVYDNNSTLAINNEEHILALENALSNIQDKKIKAIETISKIEIANERLALEKGVTDEAVDNISGWLEAVNPTPEAIEALFVDVTSEEENNNNS